MFVTHSCGEKQSTFLWIENVSLLLSWTASWMVNSLRGPNKIHNNLRLYVDDIAMLVTNNWWLTVSDTPFRFWILMDQLRYIPKLGPQPKSYQFFKRDLLDKVLIFGSKTISLRHLIVRTPRTQGSSAVHGSILG